MIVEPFCTAAAIRRPFAPRSLAALAVLVSLALPAAGSADSGDASQPVDARPFFFALSVEDVDVSAAWYERVLGFETVRETDLAERGLRIRLLRRPGGFLELVDDAEARPLRELTKVERRHRVHGPFKIGLLCDDLDRVRERLEKLEVPLRGRVIAEPDGSFRSLQIEDPDGNVIQIFEVLGDPPPA